MGVVTHLDKHILAVNVSNNAPIQVDTIHQNPQRTPLHQAKKYSLGLWPIRLLGFWCIYPPVTLNARFLQSHYLFW